MFSIPLKGIIRILIFLTGMFYSAFTPGTFGGVSFGIDNNIEAKVRVEN